MDEGMQTQREMLGQLNAQFADRSKMIVRFYMEAGRVPVVQAAPDPDKPGKTTGFKWEDQEWVEIRAPGDKDEIRSRPARESDRLSWPLQYAAFKRNEQEPALGVPLEKAAFLTKAQVMELKGVGLRTVEDLANMADVQGQKFLGFAQMKKTAVDYLAVLAGNAPIEALRADLAQRDQEIEAQKNMMEDMAKRLKALEKKDKAA